MAVSSPELLLINLLVVNGCTHKSIHDDLHYDNHAEVYSILQIIHEPSLMRIFSFSIQLGIGG
jgi:hypothetical protein